MICTAKTQTPPAWHAGFLAILPSIRRNARIAFRHLRPEAREDAVQETVANACLAYARLAERGKLDAAHPAVLARYAVAQVNEGRRVGSRLNVREVLSRYARQRKGFHVERLDRFDTEEDAWQEIIVEDRKAGPAEIVRVRMDFGDWLQTLSGRNRRLALTREAARPEPSQPAGRLILGSARPAGARPLCRSGAGGRGEQPSRCPRRCRDCF
jgi:hypothetical protein